MSMEESNAEVEVSDPNGSDGWVRVKEDHFRYTIAGAEASLYGPDEANALSVGRAARALRKTVPGLKIRVRLVPSVIAVIDEDLDWNHLLERFNETLRIGLRSLGVDPETIADLDEGGMPSEYRGFLAEVCAHAQRFLTAWEIFPISAGESADENATPHLNRKHLADEMVFATRAVAFSMREGWATLPFTMAVALKSLEQILGRHHNGTMRSGR
jgi:hypothetical protein